jgi:hypothetical protein
VFNLYVPLRKVTLVQTDSGEEPIPTDSAEETKREEDEFVAEKVTLELPAQEMPAKSAIKDELAEMMIKTLLVSISIGSRAEIVIDSRVREREACEIEMELESVDPITETESVKGRGTLPHVAREPLIVRLPVEMSQRGTDIGDGSNCQKVDGSQTLFNLSELLNAIETFRLGCHY